MSLIGRLAASRVLARPLTRRALFAVLAGVLALLTFFPERYRATMLLAPPDLGVQMGAIGQLGGLNGLIGTQYQPERLLAVARSPQVALTVAQELKLPATRASLRDIAWKTNVRTLRGGIVEVEAVDADPARALVLADKLGTAARARLIALSVNGQPMQILQPAFVDPARQYNTLPLGLLIAAALLWLALEFYGVSARIDRRR
jgi:hypothetical protein